MTEVLLSNEVVDIMTALKEIREKEGRTEKARLISIAITNLETASLYIREAGL